MDAQAMTDLPLNEFDLILCVLRAGAWVAVGALIGALHCLTLRWNVRLLAVGRSLLLALGTQLVRFAIVGGALAVIASQFGALSLIVATAGILVARTSVFRFGEQP
jgi:F1F0 ATPase subunit 2